MREGGRGKREISKTHKPQQTRGSTRPRRAGKGAWGKGWWGKGPPYGHPPFFLWCGVVRCGVPPLYHILKPQAFCGRICGVSGVNGRTRMSPQMQQW